MPTYVFNNVILFRCRLLSLPQFIFNDRVYLQYGSRESPYNENPANGESMPLSLPAPVSACTHKRRGWIRVIWGRNRRETCDQVENRFAIVRNFFWSLLIHTKYFLQSHISVKKRNKSLNYRSLRLNPS